MSWRSKFGRWWAQPQNRLLYARMIYYGGLSMAFLAVVLYVLAVIGNMTSSDSDSNVEPAALGIPSAQDHPHAP